MRLVFVSQGSLVRPGLRQPPGFPRSRQLPGEPFLLIFWGYGGVGEAPTSAGEVA